MKSPILATLLFLASDVVRKSNSRNVLSRGFHKSGGNILQGLPVLVGKDLNQYEDGLGHCISEEEIDARKYDIVYSLCGHNRKEELFRSIVSLLLVINAVQKADASLPSVFNVHLITDGSVTYKDLSTLPHAALCYRLHKPHLKAAPLFAPCSTQRLYLHEHLDFQHVKQAVYLDMDTLWMDYPNRLDTEFNTMLEEHALFAMALETTDKNADGSWYRGGFSKDLPFFGENGLNAGVLLLNLEGLRTSNFARERDKIIKHFYPKKALPLGDQDVLNAYASKYPDRLHIMSCIFNYRSDSACYSGFPAILHGNRNLKDDHNSTYSTLYTIFGRLNL